MPPWKVRILISRFSDANKKWIRAYKDIEMPVPPYRRHGLVVGVGSEAEITGTIDDVTWRVAQNRFDISFEESLTDKAWEMIVDDISWTKSQK